MMFNRAFRTAVNFSKRNFGAPAAGHAKRAPRVKEPEVDVEIAWDSVIYRGFFLVALVIGPVYMMNGGLDSPPPYVPFGQMPGDKVKKVEDAKAAPAEVGKAAHGHGHH